MSLEAAGAGAVSAGATNPGEFGTGGSGANAVGRGATNPGTESPGAISLGAANPGASASRLGRLIRASSRQRMDAPAQERCDLCAEPVPSEHRHLLDLDARRLLCACRACAILFDRRAAGGGHYRLVPERVWRLGDFRLDDAAWASLRIPVELAFFFHSTAAGRVVAFYPGPLGATESLLELESWRELEAANPVLAELEPDVEALLVNRACGGREYWLAPIDACYALVGVIRTHWKGLGGGAEVWDELGRFFDDLRRRSRTPVSAR